MDSLLKQMIRFIISQNITFGIMKAIEIIGIRLLKEDLK